MVTKGAFIRVDFDAWTADGDLFDTTSKDVARQASKVSESVPYGPMPAIVGVGRLIPGFDKALLDATVGETREVVIPPSEAYGDRDPAKVETVPLRDFQKQEVAPFPGMRVNYQGKSGTVTSVSPGRVRIDYNAALAGKTLKYRFAIREEIEDAAAKARAIIELDYGQSRAEGFDVQLAGDVATIKLPDSCKYEQRWFIAKYRIVSDLRQYAGVKTVRFLEEYVTEEPPLPPEAAPAGETPAPVTTPPPEAAAQP